MTAENKARAEHIIALYRTGITLQEIADRHGISRQRVQQILSKHGLTWRDGGKSVHANRRLADKARARIERRDQRCLRLYGCSFAEMAAVSDEATKMGDRNPVTVFARQRQNAVSRGIGWKLTLVWWWTTWKDSGHWSDRGRGAQKYAMRRYGDEGPYVENNVFIGLFTDNVSSAQRGN